MRQSKKKPKPIIKVLQKMQKDGTLKLLYDSGFISWKVLFYLDIRDTYDTDIKLGFSKMRAIDDVCEKFNINQTTVYRALKRLGYEYNCINSNDKRTREFFATRKKSDCGTNTTTD